MRRNPVRIGLPILLMVVGGVLYLAVSQDISGIDVSMVGIVVFLAGLVWLVLELVLNGRSRTSTTTERSNASGAGGVPGAVVPGAPAAGGVAGQQVVEREVTHEEGGL